MFALGLDFLILILLAIAIVFTFKLYKQLQEFKRNKDDFLKAIMDLNTATGSAERAIASLRHNSDEIAGKLQSEMGEAQKLFDELHFMNDAGNNLAQRLEVLAEKANEAHGLKTASSTTHGKSSAKAPKTKKRTKAEEELLKALKGK